MLLEHMSPPVTRASDSGAVEDEGFLGPDDPDACSAVRAWTSVRRGVQRDAGAYSRQRGWADNNG